MPVTLIKDFSVAHTVLGPIIYFLSRLYSLMYLWLPHTILPPSPMTMKASPYKLLTKPDVYKQQPRTRTRDVPTTCTLITKQPPIPENPAFLVDLLRNI